MRKILTEILINSDISKVWEVLMDFENQPRWNPFIESISGEQKVGSKMIVSIKQPGGNAMTFKPKILVLDRDKEFRWKGKLIVNGIFDGEHFFMMESISDNQTKFIHGEIFSGVLVSFMGKTLKKTEAGFNLMNESIKKECERK